VTEFQVSGPARQDLREIHDWIAQDNPAAADRVLSDLRDAIVRLADMPGLGHVRDDLADESLRVWTVHRYVVIYQPDRSPMLVVRVLSGYRDIGSIFS
jgi:plasmid stabilization system protein ParE